MTGEQLELTGELDAMLVANSNVDPLTLPVRFSRLKMMSQSAAHYLEAVRRDESPKAFTTAQREGAGVHAFVLGTPVVQWPGRRYGKEWLAFEAANQNALILNAREWNYCKALADSVRSHREASDLLFDDTERESPIDWSYIDRRCRSTPDARNSHWITELKTAQSAHPAAFVRDGLRYHYHAQLAFYSLALEAIGAGRPANAYIVVVEKSPPYVVTICRVTDRALERGERLCREWMERLLVCEQSNAWPAYSDAIVDFDLPPDNDNEPIELEIDGRLVEVG